MPTPKSHAVLAAYIPAIDLALEVVSGTITLNDSRNPYAEARIQVALPDESVLDDIDPRDSLRIQLTANVTWDEPTKPDQERTFDLYLHEREIVAESGTLSIIAESDEALLIDYGLVGTTTERTYGRSIKTAVEYALTKIGATLEPGAADGTLDATLHKTVATNLMPNPNARAGIGAMAANGTTTSLTRQTGLTGGPVPGVTTFFRNTTAVAQSGFYLQSDTIAPYCLVEAGKTYSVSVWLRSSVASKVITLFNSWYNASGVQVGVNSSAGTFTMPATPNTWVRASWLVTMPAGTARFGPNLYSTTNWASGNTFDSLGWQVTEGATLHDAFDGNSPSAFAGEGFYWTGFENASTSVKVDQPALVNHVQNSAVANNPAYMNWMTDASGSGVVQTAPGVGGPAGVQNQNSYIRLTPGNGSTGGAWYNGAAGSSTPNYANIPKLTPGDTYTVALWVCPSAAKNMLLGVQQFNASNTSATAATNGGTVAVAANTWTLLTHTFTAASTAEKAYFYANVATGSWNGTQTLDVAGVSFTRSATAPDYFDGASTSTAYSYLWTGTANLSTSLRIGPHNAAATVWEPGESAWDYLAPILQARGLRLFCDEQRNWYLIDPATYEVDGFVVISEGTNAVRGTDSISLQAQRADGSPVWYSGVVVKWTWTNDAGEPMTQYETAGTPQKVYKIEIQRPYPGAGYAATLLARAQGRGRTQDVEGLADLTTTPSMQIAVALPGVPVQAGVVSSVAWNWAADGDSHDLMTVTTRGLLDIPSNAWLIALGDWTSATGTWAGATGTN